MYSSDSYHGSEVELRTAVEQLYVDNGVDFVITGRPFLRTNLACLCGSRDGYRNGFDRFARGEAPIHLVIGMAGRSAYEDLDEPQQCTYRENSTFGWTR